MIQEIQGRASVIRCLISILMLLCLQGGLVSAQSLIGDSWSWLTENDSTYQSNKIIVQFSSAVSSNNINGPRTRQSILTEACQMILPGSEVERMLGQIIPDLVLVQLPTNISVQEAVDVFNNSASVVYAEPQYRIRTTYFPNDPLFVNQWNLDNQGQTGGLEGADINAPEGWDIERDANEIIVAVLDTGIDYNHPDLYENMWFIEGRAYPDDANFADPNFDPDDPNYIVYEYGPDFIDGAVDDPNDFNQDGDPNDLHFHGTHVAGIIGARGSNQTGISGVAPIVQLMAVRIMDEEGNGTEVEAILGINYAVGNGAHIINCSWILEPRGTYSAALESTMGAAGIPIVCSAGNDELDADNIGLDNDFNPVYPANSSLQFDNVITVMATDHFDQPPAFTNYGAMSVQIGAPGVNIWSTSPREQTDAMADEDVNLPAEYAILSGSSAAAPHVSGALALALSMNSTLTPLQLRNRLLYWNAVDHVLPGLNESDGRLVLDKFLHLVERGVVLNVSKDIPYDTIQEAIDDAGPEDDLLVQENRFYPEVIDFKGKNITLRSGDPDNPGTANDPDNLNNVSPLDTIISGLDAAEQDSLVNFISGEGAQAKLWGLTVESAPQRGVWIEGDSPTFDNCIVSRNHNGGLYASSSTTTLKNTLFQLNDSQIHGGGIWADNDSWIEIMDCNLINNTAAINGGGIYATDANLVLKGVLDQSMGSNYIQQNMTLDGFGGGICIEKADLTMAHTVIMGNQTQAEVGGTWPGGGLYIYASVADINNSRFLLNAGDDGGGIFCEGSYKPEETTELTLNTVQFQANQAALGGGGLACVNMTPTIQNCLFVGNFSNNWDGGALYFNDSSPQPTNCTFANNYTLAKDGRGGVLRVQDGSQVEFKYSIFKGNQNVAVYVADAESSVMFNDCLFSGHEMGEYENAATSEMIQLEDPNNTLSLPGTINLVKDPMFVTGRLGDFYLSQFDAGQIRDANGKAVDLDPNALDDTVRATSPAVNALGVFPDLPDANDVGMHLYSTRTDTEKDQGPVDLGFHYNDPDPPEDYIMLANVETILTRVDPWDVALLTLSSKDGEVDGLPAEGIPAGGLYKEFQEVLITSKAVDPNTYMFRVWENTDANDRIDLEFGTPASVQQNIVTMTRNKKNNVGIVEVVANYHTVEVELRVVVVEKSRGNGRVEPSRKGVRRGDTVDIKATPNDGRYRVEWHNTNNDYSTALVNTVTITPPFKVDPVGREFKEVRVEFYAPRTLHVPDGYSHIQQAIDAARPGDIIELAPSSLPYQIAHGFYIDSSITIQSSRPDDPATVNRTVIEWESGPTGYVGPLFTFTGVEPNTVLNGITLSGVNSDGSRTLINGGFGGNGQHGQTHIHDGGHGGEIFGAGILCLAASPTIKNCVIREITVNGGDGGDGVNADNAQPLAGNGGWPGAAGGAGMACLVQSDPIVENCRFVNCISVGGNGGDGGEVPANVAGLPGWGGGWDPRLQYDWNDGTWRELPTLSPLLPLPSLELKYTGMGGAVYIDQESSPTFIDCEFSDNLARGGIVGISGRYLPNGARKEPTTPWGIDGYGGAVYIGEYSLYGTSAIIIDPAVLEGLDPELRELLLSLFDVPVSEPRFIRCAFVNNITDANLTSDWEDYFMGYGGAVAAVEGVVPYFENCTFSDNAAPVGGAYYGDSVDSTFVDCDFGSNRSFHGGAVSLVDGTAAIDNSRFMNNLAVEQSVYDPDLLSFGVAVTDANDPNVFVALGIIDGTIGQGGAVKTEAGYLTMIHSVLQGNRASSSGGGIYIVGSRDKAFARTLQNCLITDNMAGVDGAGVSIGLYAKPLIQNSTIADNTVFGTGFGGGVSVSSGSSPEIIDSIIWNNSGLNGSQVALRTTAPLYTDRPASLTITHSDVQLDQAIDSLRSLDLVFCIDTTASMTEELIAFQNEAQAILNDVASRVDDLRIAITEYRDINELPYGDPNLDYPYQAVLPFETNLTTVENTIEAMTVGSEGDRRASVMSGLNGSALGIGLGLWRSDQNVKRVIILIGDASGHSPEPVTGLTENSVIAALHDTIFIRMFGIPLGGDVPAQSQFNRIAIASGGAVYLPSNSGSIRAAVLQAIDKAFEVGQAFSQEEGTVIDGWDPVNKVWDSITGNINADPLFAIGYYLSQKGSGQLLQSPAVDKGSAQSDRVSLPMHLLTTRTDGLSDTGRVDMGYHYGAGLELYWLTVETLDAFGTVEPNRIAVVKDLDNPVVTITAHPLPGYKVKQWTGTDNDASIRTVNTVTVNQDTHVTVSFELASKYRFRTEVIDKGDGPHGTLEVDGYVPNEAGWIEVDAATTVQLTARPDAGYEVSRWYNTDADTSTALVNTALIDVNNLVLRVEFSEATKNIISVPQDYETIQAAVAAAGAGDTVVLSPGTYFGGGEGSILLQLDKPITITSVNPEDPCTVASTVLDGYNNNNEGRNFNYIGIAVIPFAGDGDIVINGITVRNCGGFIDQDGADDGDRTAGHPDGYDGGYGFGPAMIILSGTSPVVKNCIFEDNWIVAADGGDGDDADGTSNAGRGGWGGWARGGAIYCAEKSSPTFINCQILNNFAQGGNGGNGGNGAAITVTGVIPQPNYGGNYSPPSRTLYDSNSLDVTVPNVDLWQVWLWDQSLDYRFTFTEEILDGRGGAGLALQSYLGDGSFYSAYGGGVYCGNASQVTFLHCEFRGNRTYGGYTGIGGVPDGADRNIDPLYPFELPSFGGAVYCDTDALVNFTGCTFRENITSDPAGPQEIDGQANVPDLADRASPHMGFGGGIGANINARVTIMDCNFVENRADVGGGVYVKKSLIDVVDSNFVANEALLGAGLSGTDGDIVVADCNFLRNTAVTDITDPNDDDVLPSGGGIYLSSSAALIMDSDFASNLTSGSAGAVFVQGNKPTIQNCLFRSNGAGRNGGAVVVARSAILTIRQSTFDRNLADPNLLGSLADGGYGGALYCRADSMTLVLDSIFRENTARLGGQFALRAADAFDNQCGTLKVDYSLLTTSINDVFKECDTLFLGEHIIYGTPSFVSGPKGNYYLAPDSDAVDKGSGSSSQLGMTGYTTQTDKTRDTGVVDMGYHYRLPAFCSVCDLVADGRIDFADFAALAQQWLSSGCVADTWCDGADVTFDGAVNALDMELFSLCWLEQDNSSPAPNPPKWGLVPAFGEGQNQVEMRAGDVEDGWWGQDLEYYFQNVSGAGRDSGWTDSNYYVDSVPTSERDYSYRFKVRDPSGNETRWSTIRSAGQYINQPPVGPMNLTLLQATSLTLQVQGSALTDREGIEYFFEIATLDDEVIANSGWFAEDELDGVDGPTYQFDSLEPQTTYRVRYKARDTSEDMLETHEFSDWFSFTTLPAVETNPPQPNPMFWEATAVDENNLYDGRPRYISAQSTTGSYLINMTATVAADPEGNAVQYFFEGRVQQTLAPELNSGWIDVPLYTLVTAYKPTTFEMEFRVYARDSNGNVTTPSDWVPVVMDGYPPVGAGP